MASALLPRRDLPSYGIYGTYLAAAMFVFVMSAKMLLFPAFCIMLRSYGRWLGPPRWHAINITLRILAIIVMFYASLLLIHLALLVSGFVCMPILILVRFVAHPR